MRSIPTIFIWDKVSRTVINKPLHMVDWVFGGNGVATRKYDGVAIKVEHGKAFWRYEWLVGKPVPLGFTKVQDPDPKRPMAPIPGWVPVPETFLVDPKGPDQHALKEAWDGLLTKIAEGQFDRQKEAKLANKYAPTHYVSTKVLNVPDGTYELCGPRIRGNHEELKSHVLLRHGADVVKGVPRTFEGLRKFLETYEGEGIVWHYKVGSSTLMAKIKRRDFGFYTRVSKEDIAMAYREEPKKETTNDVGVDDSLTATSSGDSTGNS